jgi:hypothetical protein
MPRNEKYYGANCDCDYTEYRIVLAKSEADAKKKLELGEYEAVYPGQIGDPRVVYKISPASPSDLKEFKLSKPARKPKHR